MSKVFLKVTKWTLVIIALFFGFQASFWMLNTKSTIANMVGLLGIIYLGTFIIFHTVNFIKKQLKD